MTSRSSRLRAGQAHTPSHKGSGGALGECFDGIRDGLLFVPLALSLAIPYALAGKMAGLENWQIVLWSATAYAGVAQLACLSAFSAGAGIVDMVIITCMANARHAFSALSLAPYLAGVKRAVLALLGFTLGTSSIGLLPVRARAGNDVQTYALAMQISQWAQWVLFTLVGVSLGPLLPASWSPVIGFAVPAAFLGLIAPLVKENMRSGLVAALIAAALALGLTFVWPPQLCAIAGALGGAVSVLFIPERASRDDD